MGRLDEYSRSMHVTCSAHRLSLEVLDRMKRQSIYRNSILPGLTVSLYEPSDMGPIIQLLMLAC
jgi:hypothetical protein